MGFIVASWERIRDVYLNVEGKRRRGCSSRVRLNHCFLTCGSLPISVRETFLLWLRNNDLNDDFRTFVYIHVFNCLKSVFFTSTDFFKFIL
jgi:hypothetical protein